MSDKPAKPLAEADVDGPFFPADLSQDAHPPASATAIDADELTARAQDASSFLKALAHEGRLMILCHLSAGEKSVTELETLLASRQAAVSQQLARLRAEGLVAARRDGKAIYYSLADPRVKKLVGLMYEMFCSPQPAPPQQ
jgi:ArsR family transcriptional regulator